MSPTASTATSGRDTGPVRTLRREDALPSPAEPDALLFRGGDMTTVLLRAGAPVTLSQHIGRIRPVGRPIADDRIAVGLFLGGSRGRRHRPATPLSTIHDDGNIRPAIPRTGNLSREVSQEWEDMWIAAAGVIFRTSRDQWASGACRSDPVRGTGFASRLVPISLPVRSNAACRIQVAVSREAGIDRWRNVRV